MALVVRDEAWAHVPAAAWDAMQARMAELEAAVLAAKVMLEPTNDATESVWQLLDDAYHRHNVEKR